MTTLVARLRHLLPRELRERYFPLYALVTGRGAAALPSQRQESLELLQRALQRTDLFGQLFDQRILSLEARVARMEAGLSDHKQDRHPDAERVPLDDQEYLKFETSHRGERWELEKRYRSVAGLIQPGSRVLELGCGTGTFLAICKEMGHLAIGVDSSESMVAAALDAGHDVTLEDATQFVEQQPNSSFDYVVAFHLVEHLPGKTLRKIFENVHRILRPSGRFVIETPNVGSIKTMTDYYYIDPTHLVPRRAEQYTFLLHVSGFDEVRIDVIPEQSVRDRGPKEETPNYEPTCISPRLGEDHCDKEHFDIATLDYRIAQLERRVDIGSDLRLFATKRGAFAP